ncbi:GNAT family N-acetyltransferase [Cytobacillus purgationiresistens]|uniref:Ribosomal-protein-alanine N-acetyltransferase n=1 Tax=Cytobacillus purgationiresistens TaxID=863449 RepID=A0ABU0ADK3_9BACI|nr:GNAT family protein [Cytobacillus purgationiresistens]MDQ0269323.1 ribosomal-protein-alanine N-acetyltransferase [Cytobacillus purgationiresistens]
MVSTFKFTHFPELKTERLTLRNATINDSNDLFELYSSKAVVEYMPFTPFTSVEQAVNEMNWYQQIFDEQTGLRWMIQDRESKKVIGTCGYLNYERTNNRLEIGYDLSPEYWGRGLMPEAVKSIIQFGFSTMNLNKIEAKIEPANTASLRLMEKLGFQKEGLLRQHEFEKGRYIDLAVFSLLRSEY